MKGNVATVERSAGKRPLERVLPIILVREKICYMPCGGIGKFTFGRINYKIRTFCEKNSISCTIYWYTERVGTSRLRLWQCRAEGFGLLLAKGCDPITALTPTKQKHSLKLSGYINGTAVLFLIREVFVKLAQAGSETVFGWHSWGKTGTIVIKKCSDKIFLQCQARLV